MHHGPVAALLTLASPPLDPQLPSIIPPPRRSSAPHYDPASLDPISSFLLVATKPPRPRRRQQQQLLHPLADAAPGPSPTSSSSLRPSVTTSALAGASASRPRGSKPLRHLPGQVDARADPKLSCAAIISRRGRSGKIASAASSPSCASREPAFLAEPRGVALLRQLAPLHGRPPLPVHASGFVQVR